MVYMCVYVIFHEHALDLSWLYIYLISNKLSASGIIVLLKTSKELQSLFELSGCSMLKSKPMCTIFVVHGIIYELNQNSGIAIIYTMPSF